MAAVLATAALVAACGSSSSATGAPATAAPAEATAAAPQAADQSSPASDGGAVGSGEAEAVAKALVPPHSTEQVRTTADGVVFATYESTDSIDALKSLYEGAIPKTGLQVVSTSAADGGYSWVISKDAAGSFGGAVSIYPSGNGTTAVQVTVGQS